MHDPENETDSVDATASTQTATVPLSLAGSRLDVIAATLFPDFSRSKLSDWIKSGRLTVNGTTARPRDTLTGGESLVLEVQLDTQTHALPQDIPIDVLYEDADLFVVNKPAGLVVHPGAGNPDGTLVNALLFRDPTLAQLPRAGIVHRLDKDTSGVMVVARSMPALNKLVEMLAARDVHRQYLAVVVGALVSGGTADAPIDRHPRDRLRMTVREDGRHAVTHYRLRERFRAHTLLECRLETGRTHQIRVHMQFARHPIVGDPLYGSALRLPKNATDDLVAQLRGFKRQALHAEVLAFEHPVHGGEIRCEAPVPEDLKALIAALRDDTEEFEARDSRR